MSDDEIRALRDKFNEFTTDYGAVALADEALARGANFDLLQTATIAEEKRLRERINRLQEDLEGVMTHEDENRHLRERVAQLETALREIRAGLNQAGPDYPACERINAALAAGKP